MEEKKFNKGDKVRIDLSTMIVENQNDKVKFDLFNGKVGKVLYTDKFGVAVKIDGGFSDSFAHSYLTTVKKRKGGNAYLKEKLSSLEAKLKDVLNEKDSFADDCKKLYKEKEELKQKVNEKAETIHKQAAKISELTAEIANLRGTARDYRRQFEEAVRHMGWLRRWWYGHDRPQFTDEDHWHD